MKVWIVFALVSMVFAGFTSVIAKLGLTGISGDLGLAVRTVFVFVFVLGTAAFTVPARDWLALTPANWWWLGLSAVTTSLSWIFYYRALKAGEVGTVALIDKGSIVIAVGLAAVLFKEPVTWRTVVGGMLVLSGVFVIARK